MFVQDQIEKLSRRIKDIEENPRPEYLKSNKFRYEIELEQWLELEENWKAGKTFVELGAAVASRLARPLGLEDMGLTVWGDRISDPERYRNIAIHKLGFPDHTCDRTMTPVGLYLSGEVPVPRLMASMRGPCEPVKLAAQAIAKYLGVPYFGFQKLETGESTAHYGWDSVRYLAEQYAEFIEFAEAYIPGVKYDEDKLIESLEMDREAAPYIRDLYELRKRVPCPLSGQDACRLGLRPGGEANPKGMEFLKLYHEELLERAEKGIGALPEEKLRLLWTSTFNYGRGTMDLLAKKGVALVWFNNGTGPREYYAGGCDPFQAADAYGRKLTPLEELANYFYCNSWGSTASGWIDPIIRISRELKVDAIVDFQQVGCVVTTGLNRITAERVRDELGIPILALEGRENFMTEGEKAEMYQRLDEFLDMCIANKGQVKVRA